MRALTSFVLSMVLAVSYAAAEDEQTQRCIWQCLQAAGGNAASSAYNQCVANYCVASDASGLTQEADGTERWQAGTIDGGGFAGADAIGMSGEAGIYYFYERGRRYLRLVGVACGPAMVTLIVDGQAYPVSFDWGPSRELEAPVSSKEPLMSAIRGGAILDFVNSGGQKIFSMRLAGSNAAIAQADQLC